MAQTTVTAFEIRCSSCRRVFAYSMSDNAKRTKIFCSLTCATEQPVTEMEDRNGMWREAASNGVAPARLARQWGVAHSLVYRTIDKG